MTKTKKNKKFLIVLLLTLLLTLAIGYAAFSDTLKISGTAKVTGATFNLEFVPDVIENEQHTGCYKVSEQGCTGTISVGAESGTSDSNDQLTFSVTGLSYPGAGATFHAVIENKGTLPAAITGVTLSPNEVSSTGNGNAIKVDGLDVISNSHASLAAGEKCSFDFRVYWDPTVTELNSSKAGENTANNEDTYNFVLTVTYEQNTTNIGTGALTHTDA